jgi:preprotein translocase subunit SecA
MVGLRAIAGRDPLLEFREDIDQLYARMLKVVAYNAVFSFFSYSP